MDKGKSAMPLLAIVAIVAVVAVVMVVLQGRTPASEEAVAGEASLQGVAVKAGSVCSQLEKNCGFTTQEVVFVSADDLINFYDLGRGRNPGPLLKRGNEICPEMGYSKCIAVSMEYSHRVEYPSSDRNCSGEPRHFYSTQRTIPCNLLPVQPAVCQTIGQDRKTDSIIQGVFCTK